MAIWNLFGKKGKKAPEAPADPPQADLSFCADTRLEVTDESGLLFVGMLQNIDGDLAELVEYAADPEAEPPQVTRDVQLRGFSLETGKAFHLEGAITPAQPGRWMVENLALRRTGNDRTYFRLDTSLEAEVARAGSTAWTPCLLRNISVGGMCITTKREYRVGDQLQLRVRLLPDRDPMEVYCRVLRVEQRVNRDIACSGCFLDLGDADQEKMTQMIFELQRRKKSR